MDIHLIEVSSESERQKELVRTSGLLFGRDPLFLDMDHESIGWQQPRTRSLLVWHLALPSVIHWQFMRPSGDIRKYSECEAQHFGPVENLLIIVQVPCFAEKTPHCSTLNSSFPPLSPAQR